MHRLLPPWIDDYSSDKLGNDLMAAVIVVIMLVPQSLAYALLAGLPPQAGIYASIVPIILYALIGSSNTLAVGPVAIISLMTAATLGDVTRRLGVDYAAAALTLAALSGTMLILLGLVRGGFLANFLSHPVISGFVTASGVIIALSQMKHIFGISAGGHTLPELLHSIGMALSTWNLPTLIIGTASLAWLFFARSRLSPLLVKFGLKSKTAGLIQKAAPLAAVFAGTAATAMLMLNADGVGIVGEVPSGLPPLTLPPLDPVLVRELAMPALLISIIGFVESVSVAQTLAAKRRERINSNRELIGLGAANIGASLTGGFPVTGGFSRSVVNFDAGARTPAAGIFTAIGLALAALFLTPLLYYLPKAVLAATIIVAVLSLIDLSVLKETWRYSKADFIAVTLTILLTLFVGVEAGVSAGVIASILIHLYKTSRPHIAVVGRVPGSEHFRNVLRHDVEIHEGVLSIRVDESLYFANARFLEDRLYDLVAARPELRHVVLMGTAINAIDTSALHSLEAINEKLSEIGVAFHLSEIKGPVMDRLKRTDFLSHLSGKVFLSQHDAFHALCAGSRTRLVGPNTKDPGLTIAE